MLGQLDRVGAEAAAGADDRDPLPGAEAGLAQEIRAFADAALGLVAD